MPVEEGSLGGSDIMKEEMINKLKIKIRVDVLVQAWQTI